LSLLTVARFASLGDWFTLPWGRCSAATGAAGRTALGLVLATLWLSPLILLTMAASAWLKRWGLPAVVAGLALLAGVLDKLYGNPPRVGRRRRLALGAGAGRSGPAAGPGRQRRVLCAADPASPARLIPLCARKKRKSELAVWVPSHGPIKKSLPVSK
jgi:hypothetical protein